MTNPLAQSLISELKICAENQMRIDVECVKDLVDLEGGDAIEWVAQTFAQGEMVNIHKCSKPGFDIAFVASHHSDDGLLSGLTGPFSSMRDVETHIPTDEGWTYV